MAESSRSAWRFGVPLVCLLAGLLLAATHGVSGGDEIRRSDAPRLVDLVREAQQSVDRLSAQRDHLVTEIDTHHGGSPGALAALAAIQRRNEILAADAGLDPIRGTGLVVTLTDAQRDANGRFPRDASPDDLVVHQQDIQAVVNAMWKGGAQAITANHTADSLSLVDLRAGKVLAEAPCGRRPAAVACSPDGKHAAVSNLWSASISLFDIGQASLTPAGEIKVGAFPRGLVFAPEGQTLFAAVADEVVRLDWRSRKVTQRWLAP